MFWSDKSDTEAMNKQQMTTTPEHIAVLERISKDVQETYFQLRDLLEEMRSPPDLPEASRSSHHSG